MDDQNEEKIENEIINSCYEVGEILGSGTFGELRLGLNLLTKQFVAIKLESKLLNPPQLNLEYKFYQILGNAVGIPKVHYYGETEKHNVLVLDLLGNNLEEMFQLMNMKFQLKTICQIAIQMLLRIEYIHSKGLVYCDIKPQNFLLGRFKSNTQNIIHLIDFGLAKSYLDPVTQKHVLYKKNNFMTGTPRYMSINAHSGIELSRRDDLQSIGYVLIYFLKGSLPWQELNAKTFKKKHKQIAEMKQKISNETLCSNFPKQFNYYLNYVKLLGFDEKPNYENLRMNFENLLNTLIVNDDEIDFEWNNILYENYLKQVEQTKINSNCENKKNVDKVKLNSTLSNFKRIKEKIKRSISTTRLRQEQLE